MGAASDGTFRESQAEKNTIIHTEPGNSPVYRNTIG